jgi:uncharacterized cupredoxin-like copper-binding protein
LASEKLKSTVESSKKKENEELVHEKVKNFKKENLERKRAKLRVDETEKTSKDTLLLEKLRLFRLN